jgi:hypothetical protein
MPEQQPTASGDVEALTDLIDAWWEWADQRTIHHDGVEYVASVSLAHSLAAYVQAARDEERERVLGEVEERVADLPTTRTQAWTTGWDSVPLHAVQVIVREARGGAR